MCIVQHNAGLLVRARDGVAALALHSEHRQQGWRARWGLLALRAMIRDILAGLCAC